MGAQLKALAIRRQALVERSSACRLQLRGDLSAVRAAVAWRHVPQALATMPAARTAAWSLALSLLGTGRVGRMLVFASRVLLVARIARAAIGYVRTRSAAA